VKRLPALAFGAMVAATIFAFFLTQVLKSAPPLVYGVPKPVPAAFHPVSGRTCPAKRPGTSLNYRRTTLRIKLFRAGTVGVYVVDNAGNPAATISEGRSLRRNQPSVFVWKGFENGGKVAPDGRYFFQLLLVNQGRTIDLSQYPITVMTHDPRAPATSVAPTAAGGLAATKTTAAARTTGPVVLTPSAGSVTIHFKAGAYRRVWIDIYRSDVSGALKRVYRFSVNPAKGSTVWEGNLAHGAPAPAGTYLIGIGVEDQACNPGRYPVTLKPSPGSTPRAGVTVRYLAATPPLTPTRAGSSATVQVDSPTGAYKWALRLAGKGRVLARGHGSGSASSGEGVLRVRLPKHNAALYTLTLSAGQYSTAVPLVATAPRTGGRARRVLVVLPMLTWQGQNPVDDSGDGLPDTLSAGDQISLARPLAHDLPLGFRQDSALISYLTSQHYRYQLTTDIALAQGRGPSLTGYSGVVLAGSETWLPRSLVSVLERFVRGGGRVLSLGADSLTGSSQISGFPSNPVASAPRRIRAGLFGPKVSVAGITDGTVAVTAFGLGKGYLFEVGLPDFNSTLAATADSQALFSHIWQLLAG
jgi:hypothetical protein